MRTQYLLAAAATILLLGACGGTGDEAADANIDVATANEMPADGPATAPAAADFVSQAAASDLYEIEAGQLAAEKATNGDIKAFGQMLATDHRRSSEELKAAAGQLSPAASPPTALPADKQAKIDALKAANGAQFDRLFLTQQVEAHTATLDLLQAYASGGDAEPLKGFAAKAAPVVQAHLEKARSLQQ